ncbi:hypothetical protein V6N13_053399 [Hibiscus sabdariffa]|uniref:Uncharacterized protein n=1 Tax=Hibiscus sabdariffa TaxID=183260 RepID=A0ABR2T7M7_9ROSI
MSGSGGVSIARSRGGENRFYNPPPMRKQQQQQQQQKQMMMQPRVKRFLEFTTPVVSAQYLPKTSIRGCKGRERGLDCPPYFGLKDLWESFKEWSAYGAGVPLLLNGSDYVMQYYVPYLSGIQLYIDPSIPSSTQRMPGEESDTESSRETSSDGSDSDYGTARRANSIVPGSRNQLEIADSNIQRLTTLSLRNRPFGGSSSDESDTCNTPGQLIFEYLEHDQPFSREPLADKDTDGSDYLNACFLTYHSLSTPSPCTGTDRLPFRGYNIREFQDADMSLKLPLPTFGLAFYKFKESVWNPDGVTESQNANSLLQAADNWLRLLQVNHPDFKFFVSHNTYWR